MLSQLRTAVVPPPPPSSQPFTRHPRPPLPQSASGTLLSPLAPAPIPQSHQVNGLSNGALSNWTSINQDAYSALPNSGVMAGGAPWTDAEKIQLLVEILKDCEVVAPNWRNIRIPPGRTSLQAQQVFALLTTSPEPSPATSPTVAPPAPQAQPASAPSRKRAHPPTEAYGPKTPGTVPKRKRGRPSKADIALRGQAAQAGSAAATWQPQMYTPDEGRGGVSLLAATPGVSQGQQSMLSGSLHEPLADQPPAKKKRGRPTKAEMEARRERARLEALHAQGIHSGGDLPPAPEVEPQPQRQKEAQDQRQLGQEKEQDRQHAPEQGQGQGGAEDFESEEGGANSPEED